MANIKSTSLDTSVPGRRLARVVFTPLSADPASQFDVEVVFQVRRAGAVHLDGEPYAVIPLSCTRTDTREVYQLSAEQRDEAIDAALVRAAEEDGLSLG